MIEPDALSNPALRPTSLLRKSIVDLEMLIQRLMCNEL